MFAVLCARVDNMDFVERDGLCSGSLDLHNDVSIAETPYCKTVGWLVSDYLEGIWKGFGRKHSCHYSSISLSQDIWLPVRKLNPGLTDMNHE